MPPRKSSRHVSSPRRTPTKRKTASTVVYTKPEISPVRHQVDLAVLQRVMVDYSPEYDGQHLACVERTVVGPSYDVDALRFILTEKGLNANLAVFVTIGKRPYGVYSFEDGYGDA